MSVKSSFSADRNDYVSYPKLMKHRKRDLIVLIVGNDKGYGTGTVIVADDTTFVGRVHRDWNLINFVNFHGTVTLRNDTDNNK